MNERVWCEDLFISSKAVVSLTFPFQSVRQATHYTLPVSTVRSSGFCEPDLLSCVPVYMSEVCCVLCVCVCARRGKMYGKENRLKCTEKNRLSNSPYIFREWKGICVRNKVILRRN